MEYLGLSNVDNIVSKSEIQDRLNQISDRIKQHRRKVRENVLPDFEELAFMNSQFKLVDGKLTLSSTSAPSQPRVFLGVGDYKVVIKARNTSTVQNINLKINIQRVTSPTFLTDVLNEPLTSEFKTYEYDLKVETMGNYLTRPVLTRATGTSGVVEIEELELRRVYQ